MSPDRTRARAIIEAWREQQADQRDPMRFRFIDALERRTARHVGEARRVLDERLSGLLDAYADDLVRLDAGAEGGRAPSVIARSPLSELLDHLASRAVPSDDEVNALERACASAVPNELAALEGFRELWSTVRSESQLRQSLAFEPTNAGPLNSAALVHRSMALMRELSPGYLQHFLAYIDELSWIEQLGQGMAAKPTSRSSGARKRTRKKPPN